MMTFPSSPRPPSKGSRESNNYWEKPPPPLNETSLIKIPRPHFPHPITSSSAHFTPSKYTKQPGDFNDESSETLYTLKLPEYDQLNEVDITHEPSRKDRDVTICVSLPIEEDAEPHITEFARLQRLGRFKDAKAYFKANLEHLRYADRQVMKRYADMLIECGDFKSFWEEIEIDFEVPHGEHTVDSTFELATYYRLLGILAQPSIENMDARALEFCTMASTTIDFNAMLSATGGERDQKDERPPVISVEKLDMFCLCLRVLGYLLGRCVDKTNEKNIYRALDIAANLFDWKTLYLELLARKQIWYLRDVFTAAFTVFTWEFLSVRFFGTEDISQALKVLFDDWKPVEYDEDITMGLLDLATSLLFLWFPSHENLVVSYAQPLAVEIQKHNPEHMRSRPFIRWLLVKSSFNGTGPDGSDKNHPPRPDVASLPGALLKQSIGAHLPVFVPVALGKKPDWDFFVFPTSRSNRAAIEMSLQIAKHTGDFQLQATCLKLLTLQSRHPRQFIDALGDLQLNTQGDKEGYLETCLCKYLVVTGTEEMEHLLRHLQGIHVGALHSEWANPDLRWAKGVIERALTFSVAGLQVGYKDLWEPPRLHDVGPNSKLLEERNCSRREKRKTQSEAKKRESKATRTPGAGDQKEKQKSETPGSEKKLKESKPLKKTSYVEDADEEGEILEKKPVQSRISWDVEEID